MTCAIECVQKGEVPLSPGEQLNVIPMLMLATFVLVLMGFLTNERERKIPHPFSPSNFPFPASSKPIHITSPFTTPRNPTTIPHILPTTNPAHIMIKTTASQQTTPHNIFISNPLPVLITTATRLHYVRVCWNIDMGPSYQEWPQVGSINSALFAISPF